MKGRTPSATEQRHMDIVGTMNCIACEIDGIANDDILLHHVDGRTKPGAHFKVLPLCRWHHEQDDTDRLGRIAVHPNKKRFEQTYGTSDHLLRVIQQRIEVRKNGH